MVKCRFSKPYDVGSSPTPRSKMAGRVRAEIRESRAAGSNTVPVAQLVEHSPCKREVAGAIPCREHHIDPWCPNSDILVKRKLY